MVETNMADLSDDSSVEEGAVDEIPSLSKQKKTPYFVNNVQGMEDKLAEFKLKLDWTERLDITVDNLAREQQSKSDLDSEAENDFKREMSFYNQALAGVNKAIKRLKTSGIPTKRPEDYFAEMAKSDAHMQKVREKLLVKQTALERSEKARSIREQKKQGKKIQREIIETRKQEKKKMISALKKTKKGKMSAEKLLKEPKREIKNTPQREGKSTPQREGKSTPQREGKSLKKREFRDSKYGYGGKKKGMKYNTAESSGFYEEKGGKNKSSSHGGKNFGKKRTKGGRRRR